MPKIVDIGGCLLILGDARGNIKQIFNFVATKSDAPPSFLIGIPVYMASVDN